jgi:hypothetical protein
VFCVRVEFRHFQVGKHCNVSKCLDAFKKVIAIVMDGCEDRSANYFFILCCVTHRKLESLLVFWIH